MSELSLTSIYRQISHRLLIMFLVLLMIAILCFSFFYQRDIQTRKTNEVKYSQLQQQVSYQQLLFNTNGLLEKILSDEPVDYLAPEHQQLMAYWQELTHLVNRRGDANAAEFYDGFLINKQHEKTVLRIDEQYEKNNQLKQSTVIQLQLIFQTLAQINTKKTLQQQELFTLISKDKVRDAVTVNRAKAYAQVLSELS